MGNGTYGRVYGGPKRMPQKWRPGGQKTNNICSIVPILVNYLDNNTTIIF